MGKLFSKATKRQSLRRAWIRIRSNGVRSPLQETRDAVESFERDAEQHIAHIQNKLRKGTFSFDPQKGVLKKKGSDGVRGIVMAPVRNRIVERTWLDCLQTLVPFVRDVINTPTSVGGVPDRSVPHGLAIIRDAVKHNKKYFIRADISGFFDHIPRHKVIHILSEHIDDERFSKLLEAATLVTLANEHALGENCKVFPTNEEGVAQGSPLSSLFGNILLYKFDKKFNDRGIVCVRFIDDFVMLGERREDVRKAFERAIQDLEQFGLRCHDPFDPSTPEGKAEQGNVDSGFVFLGYDIRPGLLQPSREARSKFLETVDRHIQRGRNAIKDILRAQNSFENRLRYVQTLDLLDRVIRGWGNSFSYANAHDTMNNLDQQIDEKVAIFRKWYRRKMRSSDWRTKRRTGGVCLLGDVELKSLDTLPYRFEKGMRYKDTKDMILVSTDGSLRGAGRRDKQKKGPGGWSAIFHSDGTEISGRAHQVTNNQMELTAIIEALKVTPVGSRVKIRTDSQYVYRTVEKCTVVRSNYELWDLFKSLRGQRRVNIVWIPGHSGDFHNERADKLAKEQANLAFQESRNNLSMQPNKEYK